MKRIMFVCLGNICRSPLAHAIFQHLAEEKNLQDKFHINSSGTSSYHIGESSDPRMKRTAGRHGINITHRSLQFQKEHFEEFDLIFTMDKENYQDIIWQTQNASYRKKVHILRDFDPAGNFKGVAVPDPYYGGEAGFEEVFEIVLRCCNNVLKLIAEGKL